MRVRTLCLSLLIAAALCVPAGASQPAGLAGRLVSNPPITSPPDPTGGLPGVTCTGFVWGEPFASILPGPDDTITLDVAIVPFRSGSTVVSLPNVMRLRFADGMVNGLPYKRSGWNDVRVVVRPAAHEYTLTLNGVQAGPFPNEFPCAPEGDCLTLQGLSIQGGVFEETIAWIDSLFVVQASAAGQAVLFQNSFDACYLSQNVSLGGMLIVEPPAKLGSGGTR